PISDFESSQEDQDAAAPIENRKSKIENREGPRAARRDPEPPVRGPWLGPAPGPLAAGRSLGGRRRPRGRPAHARRRPEAGRAGGDRCQRRTTARARPLSQAPPAGRAAPPSAGYHPDGPALPQRRGERREMMIAE